MLSCSAPKLLCTAHTVMLLNQGMRSWPQPHARPLSIVRRPPQEAAQQGVGRTQRSMPARPGASP